MRNRPRCPGWQAREPAAVGVGREGTGQTQSSALHERPDLALAAAAEVLEREEQHGGERVVQLGHVDDNDARGRLYSLTLTGIGPDHWGTYMDHYRKGDDGRWRFARRSVKIEGQAANSLFREEP